GPRRPEFRSGRAGAHGDRRAPAPRARAWEVSGPRLARGAARGARGVDRGCVLRAAPRRPEARMNRLVRRLVVAMLLGVAIYAAFALDTRVAALRGSLGEYRWSTFVFALALVPGNFLLRFLKWQYCLARLEIRGVRPLDSFPVFLSGFVLTVTPGKLGEVFKSAV